MNPSLYKQHRQRFDHWVVNEFEGIETVNNLSFTAAAKQNSEQSKTRKGSWEEHSCQSVVWAGGLILNLNLWYLGLANERSLVRNLFEASTFVETVNNLLFTAELRAEQTREYRWQEKIHSQALYSPNKPLHPNSISSLFYWHSLRTDHFKMTVARISFLSKLWYFQYKSKQKVSQFGKKQVSRNCLLKMNGL